MAGEQAAERAATAGAANSAALDAQVAGAEKRLKDLVNREGNENWSKIRDEMGISHGRRLRVSTARRNRCRKPLISWLNLQERFKQAVRITDTSSVFNTDLLYTIELGHGLERC